MTAPSNPPAAPHRPNRIGLGNASSCWRMPAGDGDDGASNTASASAADAGEGVGMTLRGALAGGLGTGPCCSQEGSAGAPWSDGATSGAGKLRDAGSFAGSCCGGSELSQSGSAAERLGSSAVMSKGLFLGQFAAHAQLK